ncbi:MAG: hypothetical protein CMB53_01300 [Euryarchaeota archaeon]|nr:hypothetical protein [Euryarchaeota archaeon]|tara:strand:+ start:5972 stop:6301 length:330 start_codon:yes stop_codon:yes gene_type:complete
MAEPNDMENFQRWLQTQLSMTSSIDDPVDRERRRLQIESAIREAISFRESLKILEELQVSPPFVNSEKSVRSISEPQSTNSRSDITRCPICDSEIEQDLGFCTVCGEMS